MLKEISKILFPLLTLGLVGCGHTMYHKVEGTGLYGRIPTPNGGSLVEIAIGDMNITSGILRGGATLDENTSKGGTFGTVSIGRHTHLSTVPAVNEGNIRDILTSPNADEKTKQMIAEYLITRSQNVAPSSAVTAVNAGAATGDKDSIPKADPTKTGFDNAVDRVTEVAPKIVKPIADNTAKAITDISHDIKEGTTDITSGLWDTIKSIKYIIISILGVVSLVLLGIFIWKKKQHRDQRY
jgi:hypothetical protein